MPFFKIVVLGDQKVGKTAITMSYVFGRAPVKYLPTSEDVYIKTMEGLTAKGKGTVFMHFWDTSGLICSSDEGRRRNDYYMFADAIMLVYDAEKPESYEKIETLKGEIAELSGRKPPIFILQNCLTSSEENLDKVDSAADCNYVLTSLQKEDVDQCFTQLIQHCQIPIGGYSSSIKRAPSKTSVNSIKHKVLQK